jgi:hypothetical protein
MSKKSFFVAILVSLSAGYLLGFHHKAPVVFHKSVVDCAVKGPKAGSAYDSLVATYMSLSPDKPYYVQKGYKSCGNLGTDVWVIYDQKSQDITITLEDPKIQVVD